MGTKPVCVKCGLFFRVKKNGAPFIESMPSFGEAWVPYKLWMGDLWECRGCGAQIIVGMGINPIAEHYQPDFKAQVEKYTPIVKVDDC